MTSVGTPLPSPPATIQQWDAVVVGLGAMGSAAAHTLARRGASVLGLDRYQPPHRLGSSHGGSRVIRLAYFEDPAYVPLLRRCYTLWEELQRNSGKALLESTGALMIGPPHSEVVAGSTRAAREHDLAHEILDAVELRRRFPVFAPEPDDVALFESVGGFLHPERAIAAQLSLAVAAGASLRFEEAVLQVEVRGDGVEVRTGSGIHRARRAIVSSGAWAPEHLGEVGDSLTVSRKVMAWLQPHGGEGNSDGPQHWRPDRLPVWVWAPDGSEIVYGTPSQPAPKALVGVHGPEVVKVGIHSGRAPTTAEGVSRQVTEDDIQRVRGALGQRLPELVNAPLVAADVCLYTHTPDDHFLLGAVPQKPQILIGGGFSGHGFKFAPVVGEILADLALDDGTQHPIELFDPARFAG